MKLNSKTLSPMKALQKAFGPIFEYLFSPVALGLYLTLAFIYFAHTFYDIRNQNEADRKPNRIFEMIDLADQKASDFRFKIRGEQEAEAPIALLALDDRSVEEIGRWPWSREKIAHAVDTLFSYGAKTIAFDIVFSEPQEYPLEADPALAAVFNKYHDKIILGSFSAPLPNQENPYQDYCRNEAFQRSNASKFVKLNATFIVDDVADKFDGLDFSNVFDQIFQSQEKIVTERSLAVIFEKKEVAELTVFEKNRLKYLIDKDRRDYCNHWLLPSDDYAIPLTASYLEIFKKSDLLKGKTFEQAVATLKSMTKSHPVPQQDSWTINTDALQEPADFTASFNTSQDSDGTIRRAPLFFRTGNRIGTSFIPSLPLEQFLVASGYQARVEIDVDKKNSEQKAIQKFVIVDPSKEPEEIYAEVPVDGQGGLKINYAGPQEMYPYFPATELFNEKKTARITQTAFDSEHNRWSQKPTTVDKAAFIKGRSFIFGATAVGIYDLRVTPFDKNMPGPETHLNVLGNLFDRNFIRYHPEEPKIMLWVLGALGIFMSLALAFTGAVPGFFIALFSGVGLFYFDQYLFKRGFVTTAALPALLVAFMYVSLTFYKYFTEERKKKHLRSTFSKYVSPSIVDEILKDPKNVELGGKKQHMTVFFSDVRGFTTISEKLDPQALGDVLTQYLTPMTKIVFANKGTLDKYMGDALMAFFGAPIAFADHAKYACRCALQSLVKLTEIQKEFADRGLPHIDIGIGINTGDMSAGNMGSDIVRSYTVMGDAVNLGSRLEGINKEYGTRIMISQFTYEEVKSSFTAREVDWVRVKGKNEPVRIYELICEGPPPSELIEFLKIFNEAFALYHEKKFEEALQAFKKSLEIKNEDFPAELYIERCQAYITTPPREDWDGAYTMTTK